MRNGLVGFALGSVLLVVAACGGGGTTGPTAAPATAAPAAEASAPADGGAGTGGEPSAAASVPAPASEAPPAGGGGGTAAGVCELVTAEELAGIFGEPVKMTLLPGPPDNCIVDDADGNPVTAWSLTTAQSEAIYSAFTTDPSTVEVTGVGDKAAIVQNTGLLVLKGGNLVVVMISSGADMSEEEGIEASKQIGAIAASRL